MGLPKAYSHFRVWEYIVETGKPALVFEDDVTLNFTRNGTAGEKMTGRAFRERLELALQECEPTPRPKNLKHDFISGSVATCAPG